MCGLRVAHAQVGNLYVIGMIRIMNFTYTTRDDPAHPWVSMRIFSVIGADGIAGAGADAIDGVIGAVAVDGVIGADAIAGAIAAIAAGSGCEHA